VEEQHHWHLVVMAGAMHHRVAWGWQELAHSDPEQQHCIPSLELDEHMDVCGVGMGR
jgi:hypothetical protein